MPCYDFITYYFLCKTNVVEVKYWNKSDKRSGVVIKIQTRAITHGSLTSCVFKTNIELHVKIQTSLPPARIVLLFKLGLNAPEKYIFYKTEKIYISNFNSRLHTTRVLSFVYLLSMEQWAATKKALS